jgi:hypothetical protein
MANNDEPRTETSESPEPKRGRGRGRAEKAGAEGDDEEERVPVRLAIGRSTTVGDQTFTTGVDYMVPKSQLPTVLQLRHPTRSKRPLFEDADPRAKGAGARTTSRIDGASLTDVKPATVKDLDRLRQQQATGRANRAKRRAR